MIEGDETFRRGVVRPVECWREGWRLVQNNYWLFVGINLVAAVIGYAAPLYLLLGPMMCGVYLCLLASRNGEQPSLNLLFKGFDYFIDGLIASMLKFVPLFLSMMVTYFAFVILIVMSERRGGRPPNEGFFMLLLFFLAISFFAAWTFIQVLFFFAYPLIVDRRLKGARAVIVSCNAAFANLPGLLLVVLIDMALCFVGMLFCYVGVIFVQPITFAMSLIAYRQVFPAPDDWEDIGPDADIEPPRRPFGDAPPTAYEVPPRRGSA